MNGLSKPNSVSKKPCSQNYLKLLNEDTNVPTDRKLSILSVI